MNILYIVVGIISYEVFSVIISKFIPTYNKIYRKMEIIKTQNDHDNLCRLYKLIRKEKDSQKFAGSIGVPSSTCEYKSNFLVDYELLDDHYICKYSDFDGKETSKIYRKKAE